jgi:putative phosphoesterase
MKIGILSDTHGNLSATGNAARKMAAMGVGAVFHCGDIGGSDVLVELAAVFHPLEVKIHAVFGNVDLGSGDWRFFPSNVGVELPGRFGEVCVGGKKIAILHGDDAVRFRKSVESGASDFVLSGHTHEVHDYEVDSTRCINPGTAGRATPGTCAVLDLGSGALAILDLDA